MNGELSMNEKKVVVVINPPPKDKRVQSKAKRKWIQRATRKWSVDDATRKA